MTYSLDVLKLNPQLGHPKPKRGKKSERQKLELLLDNLFSQFVRSRAIARVGGCERCGSQKRDIEKEDGSIFPAWKQLQCSHFIGRATKQTRWHEDNGSGLCGGCHMYLEHHPAEMVEWFIKTYGQRTYDLLLAAQRQPAKSVDKIGYVLYYREMLRVKVE